MLASFLLASVGKEMAEALSTVEDVSAFAILQCSMVLDRVVAESDCQNKLCSDFFACHSGAQKVQIIDHQTGLVQ